MRAQRRDLILEVGSTLGVAVQVFHPLAREPIHKVRAGDWIYYRNQPWPVFETDAADQRVKGKAVTVRLGAGLFWQPKLHVPWGEWVMTAEPMRFALAEATFRGFDNQRYAIPFELSDDFRTLTLVPDTYETVPWSRDLAWIFEQAGWPRTFDWDLLAAFSETPGTHRVVEGAFHVLPSVTYQFGMGLPEIGATP